MPWLRWSTKLLLGVVIFLDAVVVFQIWRNGPPTKEVWTEIKPGVDAVRVTRVPFTAMDWLGLVVILAVNVAVLYVFWRFRKRHDS